MRLALQPPLIPPVEPVDSQGAFPEPALPFDQYLELLNRIDRRMRSEAELPRMKGGRLDVWG